MLAEQVQALRHGGAAIVVIEGEAGIGKSCLINELRAHAASVGITALLGEGDAIEVSTPYHAWRSIFSQLFKLDEMPAEAATRQARIVAQIDAALGTASEPAALSRLLPLLSAVLPLDLPDNDLTARMTGQARADNTNDLLVRLLNAAAGTTPLLLILEDAHWLDSSSWTLARLVIQRVQPGLLVLVSRPLTEPLQLEQQELLRVQTTRRVRLEALPADEALTLACERLGVQSLPEPVAELIREKAGGHPFFTEQLVYALRDAGVIVVAERECRLAPNAPDLRDLKFLESVEGVVTSRIDRLTPRQQLLLKVASVMGRAFSLRTLSDIYPIVADRPHLADDLETLNALELTQGDVPAAEPGYLFKHAITQEVAYNLLAFSQRRRVHRALAEWYERAHATDLVSIYPLLAYHWSEAAKSDQAVVPKAIDYLEKAAEQAVTRYANEEAIRFLTGAEAFATEMEASAHGVKPPPMISPIRRAGWERQLGEAYFGVGKVAESRLHLEQALARLGFRVPARRASLAAGLTVEVVRQLLRRLSPTRVAIMPSVDRWQRVCEAAAAYSYLHLVLFIAMEQLPSVYAAMRALNLAEAAGPSRTLVNSYGAAALLSGLFHQGLGERYYRWAFETARRLHDPAVAMGPWFGQGYFYFRTGQWERADSGFEEANTIAAAAGDRRFWELSTMQRGCVRFTLGQFGIALARYTEAYDSARRRGDVDAQALATVGRVTAMVMLGQADEALRMLAALHAWLGSELLSLTDRGIRINAQGMLALASLRIGDRAAALQAAERATALIEQSPPLAHYALAGYAAVAEVSLRLWETAGTAAERASLEPLARRVAMDLRKFARVMPFARPQACLWDGTQQWLRGQRSKASRRWHQSLRVAERLRMPYEQALAHDEIGRHATDEDVRHRHLAHACELFAACGAEHNLGQARAALEAESAVSQGSRVATASTASSPVA
jgi:tetratricopeptide (TPR) repeat protein